MDVCEPEQALQKQFAAETKRIPLVPAENKNKNGATSRAQTREISSRYRSPTPSAAKRCPSPNAARLSSTSTVSAPKRATSAERKRPSRPSSPPSTPIQDTSVEMMLASRKIVGNKLPESLWPSTMRSLSVSFQSDTYSIPFSKREKPVSHTPSDQTLRPSSNVAHRQAEIPASRKPTPERKRSPLKGKNSSDQSENSKPVDSLHSRLVDQHRWPSRTSGKIPTALNRSIDLGDKTSKTSTLYRSGSGAPSLRRLSLDGVNKPLLKSPSDFLMQISRDESGKAMSNGCLDDDGSLQMQKPGSSSSSDRTQLVNAAARALSIPTSGKFSTALDRIIDLGDKTGKTSSLSRLGSGTPSLRRLSLDGGASMPLLKSTSDLLVQISCDESGKAMLNGCSVDDSPPQMQKPGSSSSSDRTQLVNAAARALSIPTSGSRAISPSVSRGVSPSRAKINASSRGPSPARGRPSSPSRQPLSSTSVLSFIADIKRGTKSANHIEDVHQLRMLYNRHLQWRYVNARACAALQSQKVKAEKMLYSVWVIIADLWDSIMEKRVELQKLRLKLKLYSVLNNQLTCLDEWASIERDHVNSLTCIIQDMQAITIRIPVTGGARGDVETIKAAVCSAVDVMRAMGSSLFSVLSRVEGMNGLVSELADVAAQERAMLDECESVMDATAAMQVKEYSLRTHLLQTKQALRNEESSIYRY